MPKTQEQLTNERVERSIEAQRKLRETHRAARKERLQAGKGDTFD